jgi:phage gp46-like protein
MSKDIAIYESGNGGDIAIMNNDIALGDQLYQQVYLALFGGNVEVSTRGDEPNGMQREDWWANSLLFGNVKAKQLNSATERALQENALNSTGRLNIIRAIESDLAYLKAFADISADASIVSNNCISITVTLKQPNTQQNTALKYLWDSAKQELITEETI